MPPLIYPDNSGGQLGTILVHPIPENTDSQIEGFPGEDITTDDCIVVFPADTGLKSMYVVFARPFNSDHDYQQPLDDLKAMPEAIRVPGKTQIKGGGGLRRRWKTNKGIIYEWDNQHGTVEKYDKRGRHLGEYDPETGHRTKEADKTRRVEP